MAALNLLRLAKLTDKHDEYRARAAAILRAFAANLEKLPVGVPLMAVALAEYHSDPHP